MFKRGLAWGYLQLANPELPAIIATRRAGGRAGHHCGEATASAHARLFASVGRCEARGDQVRIRVQARAQLLLLWLTGIMRAARLVWCRFRPADERALSRSACRCVRRASRGSRAGRARGLAGRHPGLSRRARRICLAHRRSGRACGLRLVARALLETY